MSDLIFGEEDLARFPTKYHGEITLSKAKWATICSQPERSYYKFNGQKIATTLINPDEVRRHRFEPRQFLYYKRFSTLKLEEAVEKHFPSGIYFCVVVDESTSKICTVYPVEEPKPGKQFRPRR